MKTDSVDSGRAWMVLLAAAIILFIMEGLTKALSVLLPTLEDQFETQVWVLGVMITSMKTVRDFSAPVVGILTSYISPRTLGLVGAVTVGFSTLGAAFVKDLYQLGLLVSLVNGIAFAFMAVPMYSLLGKHFNKFHSMACGIMYASGSLGLMVYAPLSQFLLTTYGWRNTFLLLAAVSFHLITSAALFPSSGNVRCKDRRKSRQNMGHLYSDDTQESRHSYETFDLITDDMKNSRCNALLKLSGVAILTNRSVLAVCAMMASISVTYGGWIVYFIPHCLVKGLSLQDASFLASAAAFSHLVGNVAHVPFISRNLLSVRGCLHISGIIATFGLVADMYAITIITIAISNIIFTFGIGAAYALCDVLLKSVVDSNMLAKAFGWRMAIAGIARIFAGFIVGWIYDVTGSYIGGFLFLAITQVLGVTALIADYLLMNCFTDIKGTQY